MGKTAKEMIWWRTRKPHVRCCRSCGNYFRVMVRRINSCKTHLNIKPEPMEDL